MSPEDAESQMKRRADKEISSIRAQLQERFSNGQLSGEKASGVSVDVARLEAVLHGGFKVGNDQLVYTPPSEWNEAIDKELYPLAAAEVGRIREDLAQNLGLEKTETLSNLFESIHISTELREDDVSPIGRKTRIDNYVKREEREGQQIYEAGFASQALCENLGFVFNPDGSFTSESRNCIVITNGSSRGIDLAQFQSKCESLASQLYFQTEAKRELMFPGKEGQRRAKER